MSRVLYLVIGLTVGLLAGWLLFGPRTGEREAPTVLPALSGASQPATVPGTPPSGTSYRPDAGRIVFRTRPAELPRPPPDSTDPAKEVQQLRDRVSQLEKRLEVEDALAREKQGVPVKPPDHLDARFDPERVRQTVNAALKELGLEGEATAVDCTEYPCLAVGEIKNGDPGRDESRRLTSTEAFGGYHGDMKLSLGHSIGGKGGQVKNLFGVAIYPATANADEQQQIEKRLNYRFNEIQDVE